MRRSWKIALVATALPLLLNSCSARQPSRSSARSARSRGGRRPPAASGRAGTRHPAASRRAPARYDDDDGDDSEEDPTGEWSRSHEGTADRWDDESSFDEVNLPHKANRWDTSLSLSDTDDDLGDFDVDHYNDSDDQFSGEEESDDWDGQASWDNPRTRERPPRGEGSKRVPPQHTRSSPSSSIKDSYDSDSDDSAPSLSEDSTAWGAGSRDDEDPWDDRYATESRGHRRGGGSGSRRSRPSAWTGNARSRSFRDGRTGGRERSRDAPGTMTRYRRGPVARRAFGVQIPALDSAALAAMLRRQMGTARAAVGQASTVAASTTKKLKREVKLAVSGSWESALLKVTWPDDTTPDENLVRSLVEAVQEFKLDTDVTKNSAEHRVLLRKLWAKMSEPDWRTVSKAVYLLHCILQKLSVESHDVLKLFLGKMSRERDRKTGRRFFDPEVLCNVNEEGAPFRSFVDRYGTYVFKRADCFNAKFQEVDNLSPELGWEHVVTTFAKALKVIDLGMSCQPEPEEETEVTVLCLRSASQDVRILWKRFHTALAWVLEEAESGRLFDGVDPAVVRECLDEFKSSYSSRHSEIVAFLADAEELLGIYGLHVPNLSIPPEHTFDTVSSEAESPSSADGSTTSDEDEAEPTPDSGDAKSGLEDDVDDDDDSADVSDEDGDGDSDDDGEDDDDTDADNVEGAEDEQGTAAPAKPQTNDAVTQAPRPLDTTSTTTVTASDPSPSTPTATGTARTAQSDTTRDGTTPVGHTRTTSRKTRTRSSSSPSSSSTRPPKKVKAASPKAAATSKPAASGTTTATTSSFKTSRTAVTAASGAGKPAATSHERRSTGTHTSVSSAAARARALGQMRAAETGRGGKVAGAAEKGAGDEEEKDSCEEGEVEDVGDLTYFDDATQAEGTDGTDGEWDGR